MMNELMKSICILSITILVMSCSGAPKAKYVEVYTHPEKGRQLSTPAVKGFAINSLENRRHANSGNLLEPQTNEYYDIDLENCTNLMYENGIKIDDKLLTEKQAVYSFLYNADVLNAKSIVRKGMGLNSGLTKSEKNKVNLYNNFLSDRWSCMEGLGWKISIEAAALDQ